MKSSFILGLLFLIAMATHQHAFAQTDTARKRMPAPYMVVEQEPEFKGGNIRKFISTHTQYPKAARKHKVTGNVDVQITVDSTGKLMAVKAQNKLPYGCTEEAERVVRLMQDWKPGKQNGRPVKFQFMVRVVFPPITEYIQAK